MKPRDPRAFSAAVTKIRSALSDEVCAKAVGRSTSLIRKWADPDLKNLPNLDQALALDMAYVEAGNAEPPILALYEDLMEDYATRHGKTVVDILVSALSVQGVVGDLSEAIREAIDTDGPGGVAITPRERTGILELLDRLDDHTGAIEGAVDLEDASEDSVSN